MKQKKILFLANICHKRVKKEIIYKNVQLVVKTHQPGINLKIVILSYLKSFVSFHQSTSLDTIEASLNKSYLGFPICSIISHKIKSTFKILYSGGISLVRFYHSLRYILVCLNSRWLKRRRDIVKLFKLFQ